MAKRIYSGIRVQKGKKRTSVIGMGRSARGTPFYQKVVEFDSEHMSKEEFQKKQEESIDQLFSEL